jgi:hypothetical protein
MTELLPHLQISYSNQEKRKEKNKENEKREKNEK